jgi:hypothetical protein
MSLTAFKKKSIIQYGTKRSGLGPVGVWIPQGPFGKSTELLTLSLQSQGPGFSINGGHRNIGYVSKTSLFSKNFTPYRGAYSKGNGGCCGTYYNKNQIYPSRETDTLGNQYEYIKPSVLSNKGMLERKYKWIHNGVYPSWVVNSYALGNCNLSDNESQGVYIQNLSSTNDCHNDINNVDKYINYFVKCGPYNCNITNGDRYTYNQISSNSPYTKTLYQPLTASQYILQIQRKCLNNPTQYVPGNKNGNNVCAVPLSVRLN